MKRALFLLFIIWLILPRLVSASEIITATVDNPATPTDIVGGSSSGGHNGNSGGRIISPPIASPTPPTSFSTLTSALSSLWHYLQSALANLLSLTSTQPATRIITIAPSSPVNDSSIAPSTIMPNQQNYYPNLKTIAVVVESISIFLLIFSFLLWLL